MKGVNPIALAVPIFFLLIGVELLASRFLRRDVYRLSDALTDLGCGVVQQVFMVFARIFVAGGYIWLYDTYHLFEISTDMIWAWVVVFIGVDFFYYWFHRSSHEVNFMWAAHVVHHQSEEYNLAVALRQAAFQPLFSWVFYLPLALIGFPPLMFLMMAAFNTLYQFWIHTRLINRLGILEYFLNTPSHHRVHHGRNPKYIDKNHGGTLIIWDKLFGTFQKEEEEPIYGVTLPVKSWNPVWANFHYWQHLFRVAAMTKSWSHRLRLFVDKPKYCPPDVHLDDTLFVTPEAPKFDARAPRALALYTFTQFLAALAGGVLVLDSRFGFTMAQRGLLAVLVVAALWNMGGLLEGKTKTVTHEAVRLAFQSLLLVAGFTAGWLSAPLAQSLGLITLTSALGLVWVARLGIPRTGEVFSKSS